MTDPQHDPIAHAASALTTPDWLADAVFYQIFPERFANGDASIDPPGVVPWDAEPTRDNFFGGDFAGITAHLDHIAGLGANAIYLTPIFQADTNHRYDATDYFAIDPRLGDLEAFRTFLAEAHARGIRVVLDAVFNHCGEGHPAFRDVMAHEASSPYVNWFSVEGFPVVQHPEPNYRTCSGCWYLPKWNAYNPEVREHHLRVATHWLAEGIDGWRLDVPYFINHSFWREFRRVVKDAAPEAYIVAEEWRDPLEWLDGSLADGTMNYTLRDAVLGFTADGARTAPEVAATMNALGERLPAPARRAMLNLLGSHDTERVLTRHGGDRRRAQLAYALLFAAEGAPMVYYGDEVGLLGDNDPGCRGAMPWDESRWDRELLEAVRGWAQWRASEPAARRGRAEWFAEGDDVLGVVRRLGDREVAVVVNRGAEAAVADAPVSDGRVEVPAAGSVVLVRGRQG
ncbi:MAG: glycoside hydrolase family 13 protein [Actinomycetales bacterium]|nr:glycoside hydrolase family 13 protein [Actinomycetales bacterium]